MRELPSPLTPPPPPAHSIHGQSRPLSPPAATTSCDGRSCRGRPYSGTGDFEANAAMILIILLCALICALALNTAIRCFLRGNRPQHQQQQQQQQSTDDQQKGNAAAPGAALPSLVVYSDGVKATLAGAETAAECAICLSEFEEGQGIRVMGRCNHGFHDHCIHQWLSSHSSCPTCRSICLLP